MSWYTEVLNKYAVFDGRAGRPEYWYFLLLNIIILLGIAIVDQIAGLQFEGGAGVLSSIYYLAVLIPSLAVSIRRLHDTNRSGWWFLISLIPLAGTIILIIWFAEQGTPGANQYGAVPRTSPSVA